MPEMNPISPLLDGFRIGQAVSEHHDVACYPAMKVDSESKYIVKAISLPTSQRKVAGLLLGGAFSSRSDVHDFFHEQARALTREADLLKKLSKLEGFTGFEGWQIVPLEDNQVGCRVFFLSPYCMTLERFLRKNPMGKLDAVNMSLDLCAALSIARRNGYLYADLKPGNIMLCDSGEYRICDLGFLELDSLHFTSLPERCISPYLAPEIVDAYSSLNETLDVYALGMVLYELFNGSLPFEGRAPLEPLAKPAYADEPLWQIIQKAIHPDPSARWQSPREMADALVQYLQAEEVSNDPIIPTVQEPELPEEAEQAEVTEPTAQDVIAEVDSVLETVDPAPAQPEVPEGCYASDLFTMAEEAAAQPDIEDMEQFMAQVDELLLHDAPAPVVAPEIAELPTPEPILPELPAEAPAEEIPAEEAPEAEEAAPAESVQSEQPAEEPPAPAPEADGDGAPAQPRLGPVVRRIAFAAAGIALLCALIFGGKYYYDHYYIQSVAGLTVSGHGDTLTVQVQADMDMSLLTVVCTDSYGNAQRQSLSGGEAQFRDLRTGTRYQISLEISGWHRLIGTTTAGYTVPAVTVVSGLTIVTGSDDSSAIVSFQVQGPDSAQWQLRYTSSDGSQDSTVTFPGHMVTLTDLVPGKDYRFTVSPVTELYLSGSPAADFHVSGILSAENLAVTGCTDSSITVTWDNPRGAVVPYWTVRCYNAAGFDLVITVDDTCAVLEGVDPKQDLTIEVTAAGMSVPVRTHLAAGALSVSNITADTSAPGVLVLTWEHTGTAPKGGWVLLYSIDGGSQNVLRCDSAEATIAPALPGSAYDITIQQFGGSAVFGGTTQVITPEAPDFSGYQIHVADFLVTPCRTPSKADWTLADVPAADRTDIFAPGDTVSLAITLNHQYNTSPDVITTTVVIRDAGGAPVSILESHRSWTSMWYRGFGSILLSDLPTQPGEYTVSVYFNYATVTTVPITIA